MTFDNKQATHRLEGVVKRITFENKENGYFVAKVDVAGQERTVTGYTPSIVPGEHIDVTGSWKSTQYGPSFQAKTVKLAVPTQTEGIVKFLANSIPGIGIKFAEKLVSHCGVEIFNIIEKTPEKLLTIKGVGKAKVESLVDAYGKSKANKDVMSYLYQVGLSTNRATRIIEKLGNKAMEKIRENPYILCDEIRGIGFKTADATALKAGIPEDSEYRIKAALHHLVDEAESEGSCAIPYDVLLDNASTLLKLAYNTIEPCIEYEIQAEKFIKDTIGSTPCIWNPKTYHAEKQVAELLLRHAGRHPEREIRDYELMVLNTEFDNSITLEHAQREAVYAALANQFCIITGGPGTGKTTITRIILECLAQAGLSVINLAAPTGKAAQRASDSTGFPGSTIHRLLVAGKDGRFKFNETNPLNADVLVIDEYSMVDIFLTLSILKALKPTTRLLFVGDFKQLSSVGPGKVFKDLVQCGAIPLVKLTQVFRQAATSQIVLNAHAIDEGRMPTMGYVAGSDFTFFDISPRDPKSEEDKVKTRETIQAELLRTVRDMYKQGYDPIRDVQVLAPMRKGLLGTEALNIALQRMLNPKPAKSLKVFEETWGTGDKVMQRRNNYDKDVLNGSIGYIEDVDTSARTLLVEFDGKMVEYKADEFDELTLAYAFTIHKSQGSEFPVVIMPLDTSHWMMLWRNLVYTCITRAKKRFIGFGPKVALRLAIEKTESDERWTKLLEWMRQGLPPAMRRELEAESA